jgi:hypothetical protein
MLKKLTFAAILVISLASCSDKKAAFNYSENFVKKEQSLANDVTITEEKVERYIDAEQFDSIAIAGERMAQLVEVKIQEVKKEPVPDVKEAQNFKEACIRYFTYVKSIYNGYKEFGLAHSDTEREAAMKKVIEITGNKKATIDAVKAAQKKFADANGFRLE